MAKEEDKKQIKKLFSPPETEKTETQESADLLAIPNPEEKREAEDADAADDLVEDDLVNTQYSNGHTYNPQIAAEQGLTYTPPHDPAVLPNDNDPQGVEIAAGFAPSMEDSDPGVERLPNHVDNNDLDLLDDVYEALRLNSETAHLDNVKIQVNQQNVYLLGTVDTQDDIGRVHTIVHGLRGVRGIKNNIGGKAAIMNANHQQNTTETFTLKDSRRVMIRSLQPDDTELLVQLFHQLSERSKRLRFHGSVDNLTPEQITEEAKNLARVNTQLDMALAATLQEDGDEHIVAVVRFSRAKPTDTRAEIAMLVRDDLQNQGLGTYLTQRLTQIARSMGIHKFVASIIPENRPVVHVFEKLNLPVHQKKYMGETQLSVEINFTQKIDRKTA
jgi:acetyltransferase